MNTLFKPPMPEQSRNRITVWFCDQCGYWRKEKATGKHQTNDQENWRGPMVVHELREATFAEVAS